MSTAKEILNAEYSIICQQLGDAYLKLNQIKSLISDLERKAAELNSAFPVSQKIEAALQAKQAVKDQAAKAQSDTEILNRANRLRAASDSLSTL